VAGKDSDETAIGAGLDAISSAADTRPTNRIFLSNWLDQIKGTGA
jgi:hypothetical protein